ncbi:hypothetical protein F1559_000939 [Cyanidiococcus yangmingshanensis]|uniref:Uncharacterized protein n=1 Tax=Cyanidiococcus yangmingshanensis TaxID=2690220 RepID=A0A7J7ICY9_9RHOD|nr:hypothetical protein F1559_000939 [Cyanidiococcus yangmingshanensis]
MQRALFRGISSSLLCRGALRFLLRLGGSWRGTNANWLRKLGRVGLVLFGSWLLLLFLGEVLAACIELVIQTLALFSAQVRVDDDDERVPRWRAMTRRLAKTVRVPASLGSLTRFRIGFGTRIAFCWGVASFRPWAGADEQVFRTTSVDPGALVGSGTKTGALGRKPDPRLDTTTALRP